MKRIISFVSWKGGNGKTTACINLAGIIAHDKRPARIMDADPQASLFIAWNNRIDKELAIAVIHEPEFPLLKTTICDSVIMSESMAAGLPLIYYNARHPINQQFKDLVKEIGL